ncbi:MAG: polymer-forming cytoskeletal protein [Fidelibacterota bacterium]|nr:MAG: polymer-forming cytoskeletal protein [Candidatus Neomarinimicrobiota bacterium]
MAREENSQTNTIVGPNTVIQGNLDIKGSLLIYGTVLGDVHCNGQVRTAKDSMIKGAVVAQEAVIDGELDGSLTTKGRATLGSSACMIGDLRAELLVIEEGAQYSGKCKMQGAKIKATAERKDGSPVSESSDQKDEEIEVEADT